MTSSSNQGPVHVAKFTGRLRFGTFALVLGLGCFMTEPAHAGLKFCNNTGATQNVSVGFQNKNDDWQSEGWWVLRPDECKTVVAGELKRKYYYYRIKSGGVARKSDADYTFCTKTDAYTIIGDKNCEGRGYITQWFKRIDTGNSENFTLNIE